jgi:hypothetical protein
MCNPPTFIFSPIDPTASAIKVLIFSTNEASNSSKLETSPSTSLRTSNTLSNNPKNVSFLATKSVSQRSFNTYVLPLL